ncbi:protein PTM1 [Gloeophyllum trabeum ATCC 11539]|uniref:Protein PTM1 n=1 Tax=Gloeophyllum trabeum (strain ATCC 11539 / FP-39264 / Madison 617) TaxID=670483 RepID=S7QLT4_GLOTA|nr:protein PTM1 [Gloeophyllum trabeum ATCC 11539]EPQ60397.1 protein PTM1 [Gloeophyllum trabeum ATCC 11539]
MTSRRIPWLLLGLASVAAYEVPVRDTDYSRQVCTGMWGGSNAHINVSFDSTSQGQLAMVIYEWRDMEYLGKVTSMTDDSLPKTYVCTSDAMRNNFCNSSQLGRFIIDLPEGKSVNQTSFWSARVGFGRPSGSGTPSDVSTTDFWDNPDGNPVIPEDENTKYTSPWLSRSAHDAALGSLGFMSPKRRDDALNPSPSGILWYQDPIQYQVRKTGYYCVAMVPVTVLSSSEDTTDVPYHPTYNGVVLFQNTFNGKLPATDYPKVNFYLALFLIYSILAGIWGWLCYTHVHELLPIQYYLSGLVGFLVVEMLANFAYYRYLNAHGKGAASTVFLFVVAILDAGRNALSFFMLLVVSQGLSVVRESLGRTMLKCQLLAGAHFVFGVLYAVGIVELELESTSALVLLLFVIPLAFTLSGFLVWILYSLNHTIAQLKARKQRYKLSMFQKLHRILMGTVLVIIIFFAVSTFTFSERLAEDYAAKTWRVRWWLLDGWLALLYLVVFGSICFLWRPSANNRR